MSEKDVYAMKFLLSDVPEDKKFICIDEHIFNNIKELANALKCMKEGVFNYHVNLEKNDFSNWIYDVIGDIRLAEILRNTENKDATYKHIKKRITYIKNNFERHSFRSRI